MRIAAFLLGLLALFGVAVAVGGAVGPEPTAPERTNEMAAHGAAEEPAAARTAHGAQEPGDGAATPDSHGGGHGGASGGADAVRGLATAQGGLRLVLDTPELARDREQTVRFRVVDRAGRPIRSFDRAHERRMHTIVVRRDLSGFRHVHPRMDADGTWTVPLRLADAGSHRLYADFERDGEPHTLAADLRVDGAADLRPLPSPAPLVTSDGGDAVRLDAGRPRAGEETTLRFSVTDPDGRAVPLQPYLGAGGHLVALREGDLAFLHVHPVEDGGEAADGHGHAHGAGDVAFATAFPSAGAYRLFLQYKTGGEIRTAAFTLEVAP